MPNTGSRVDFVPEAIAELIRQGWTHAARVECHTGRFSRDLFGFGDVLGLKLKRPNPDLPKVWYAIEVAILQVTDTTNFSKRKRKVEQLAQDFSHPDVFVEVWGYKQKLLARRERFRDGKWERYL